MNKIRKHCPIKYVAHKTMYVYLACIIQSNTVMLEMNELR